MDPLRIVAADNAGPFTLDGTRTHLVGSRRVAVVDPGPDDAEHLDAVARALTDADDVTILQTHDHADHAAGSARLAELVGASVAGAGEGADPLDDGAEVPTDVGRLVVVETPGHAEPHLSFHWPAARTVFVGDLLLGEGDTTWLGAYSGCVADFFASLDRIGALDARILRSAHGPPIRDPAEALERYRTHRRARLARVREVLEAEPEADVDQVARRVYGTDVPEDLWAAIRASAEAMIHHVRTTDAPTAGG